MPIRFDVLLGRVTSSEKWQNKQLKATQMWWILNKVFVFIKELSWRCHTFCASSEYFFRFCRDFLRHYYCYCYFPSVRWLLNTAANICQNTLKTNTPTKKKYAQYIHIMINSSCSFAHTKYITLGDLVLKEANTQFFAWERAQDKPVQYMLISMGQPSIRPNQINYNPNIRRNWLNFVTLLSFIFFL